MPLPPPHPSEVMHMREIVCYGLRRTDGLWDIEARMVDRKSYAVINDYRSVEAGAPFHEMALRLTVDDSLQIRGLDACIDAAPFEICSTVAPNLQCLVGQRIGAGFGSELRRRHGGVNGCTHLIELFGPLVTVAIQTVCPLRRGLHETDAATPPSHIGGCHALSANGDVVARYWPRFCAS